MRIGALACAIIAAVAALTGTAAAQTLDEIVSRHIDARGGYERLKAIQTIRITRTVAAPFSDIRVIIYKKRPHLYRAEQGPVQAGAVLTPRGINAQDAWDMTGGKVVTRTSQAASEARDIDGDFDGLLVDWKAKGHTVTLEGREALPGGRDAYKLKVVTKAGAVRTIYLDASTYLDLRHTGVLNLPGGRQANVSIDFSNWRDVNGVKFPFDINEDRTGREPAQSFVTYTEKIEVNVPMDDSLFATPGTY